MPSSLRTLTPPWPAIPILVMAWSLLLFSHVIGPSQASPKSDWVIRYTNRVGEERARARKFVLDHFEEQIPHLDRNLIDAVGSARHSNDEPDVRDILGLIRAKGEDGLAAILLLTRVRELLPAHLEQRRLIDRILRDMGPKGLERLFAFAADPAVELSVRRRTKEAILRMDPTDASGRADLGPFMRAANDILLDWIARATTDRWEEMQPHLLRGLESEDPVTRRRAVQVSAAFGSHGDVLLPLLTECANHDDVALRWWSTWALGAFQPESLPSLLERLRDDDAGVRARAAEAIEKSIETVDVSPSLVDAIRDALDDPSPEVRTFAAVSAWKLGEAARPLTRELARSARDENLTVRLFARNARARLTAEQPPEIDLRDRASTRESSVVATVRTMERTLLTGELRRSERLLLDALIPRVGKRMLPALIVAFEGSRRARAVAVAHVRQLGPAGAVFAPLLDDPELLVREVCAQRLRWSDDADLRAKAAAVLKTLGKR